MLNKIVETHLEALAVIQDGASVLISGFGDAGVPFELLKSLEILGPKGLIVISNNLTYNCFIIKYLFYL